MDQSTIISLLTQNKSSNFKGRLHCQSRYRLSCMAANPHKRGGFPFSSTSTQSSSSGGGHSAAHWRREQQTNNSCSRSGKEIFNHYCNYHHHCHHSNSWGSDLEDIYIVCYISGNLSHRWKPKMTLLLTLRQSTSPLWVWAASPPASRLLGRSCRGDPLGWPYIQGTLIVSAGSRVFLKNTFSKKN